MAVLSHRCRNYMNIPRKPGKNTGTHNLFISTMLDFYFSMGPIYIYIYCIYVPQINAYHPNVGMFLGVFDNLVLIIVCIVTHIENLVPSLPSIIWGGHGSRVRITVWRSPEFIFWLHKNWVLGCVKTPLCKWIISPIPDRNYPHIKSYANHGAGIFTSICPFKITQM